jgi:methionyl-tRNA formyltransferase
MDAGAILARTRIPIKVDTFESSASLEEFLAPEAANFLVNNLRKGVFVEPIKDLTSEAENALKDEGRVIRHARKFELEDKHINWKQWTADDIMRRHKVFGSLWSTLTRNDGTTVKIVWGDTLCRDKDGFEAGIEPGCLFTKPSHKNRFSVNTVDGECIWVEKLTAAGDKGKSPVQMEQKYSIFSKLDLGDGKYVLATQALA